MTWRFHFTPALPAEPFGQPLGRRLGWPVKLAALVVGVIVLVPLLALVLAALLVGIVAVALFGAIVLIRYRLRQLAARLLRGGGLRDDGRRNVRVVERS